MCWSWVNISLSEDASQWFPQSKSHSQQEEASEFHGQELGCSVSWELIEERRDGCVFVLQDSINAENWNGEASIVREPHCEHRGTMRGVRSHPGGGGQQLKSQQCCEMVRVRLKAHEAIYHAPHSRPAALRWLSRITGPLSYWDVKTQTVFSLTALNNAQLKPRERVAAELKDAWQCVEGETKGCSRDRVPRPPASNWQAGTKTRVGRKLRTSEKHQGEHKHNPVCSRCQDLNATAGQNTVSSPMNILLK